jgi:DNA-binding transcriptional LysR family regulator
MLLTLAEQTTFTGAAAELGVTQSAVSRSVLQIEERFGVELLNRGRHGCQPTIALQRLLPGLRRAQRALESISQELQAADGLLRGSIRIVGFRSATAILLPPIISGFMARHSQMRISISTVREVRGGVQQYVLDGKADFGVTSVKPQRSLRAAHLGADPYVVVRRKEGSHRFAPEKERFVLWKERCSDRVPQILGAQHWKPRQVMSVDTDTAVLGMLEYGGGFTIIPKLATEPLPADLERIALSAEFQRDIWLCAYSSMWNSTAGRSIARSIIQGTGEILARIPMQNPA